MLMPVTFELRTWQSAWITSKSIYARFGWHCIPYQRNPGLAQVQTAGVKDPVRSGFPALAVRPQPRNQSTSTNSSKEETSRTRTKDGFSGSAGRRTTSTICFRK